MKPTIKIIRSDRSSSNSYLIETPKGFILIITGTNNNISKLESVLSGLGCASNHINLIIFTSCNSCNSKNYNYLKKHYNAKIAMHVIDQELLDESEHISIFKKVANLLKNMFHPIQENKNFKPDLIIDEGYNLSEFGLNARVLYLPGYSKSVGILTENGELFCDDLNEIDDYYNSPLRENSGYLQKLRNLLVNIVYPSDGDPLTLHTNNIY